MIPLKLTLRGFLSYQEPTEIDFSAIHVACILGHNGAGKSSILDGITWALFGEARKSDDSLINSAVPDGKAWVELDFLFEDLFYRVRREKNRGKSSAVSFLFRENEETDWRSLTEKTVLQTNKRICEVLRMDYDTFVNVSFFLQGRADSFTGQKPGDRKAILSKILNLDVWEDYKAQAVEKRKAAENALSLAESEIAGCDEELAEEDARRAALAQLQTQLETSEQQAKDLCEKWNQAKLLENSLNAQKEMVENLGKDAEKLRRQIQRKTAERDARVQERNALTNSLRDADRIETAYQSLQQVQAAIDTLMPASQKYHALDRELQQNKNKVETQERLLNTEFKALKENEAQRVQDSLEQQECQRCISDIQPRMQELEKIVLENTVRPEDQNKANSEIGRLSERKIYLKKEADQIKEEIIEMDRRQGTQCPTCGHWVNQEDCAKFRQEKEANVQQKRNEWAEAHKRSLLLSNQMEQMAVRKKRADEAAGELLDLRQSVHGWELQFKRLAAQEKRREENSRRQQQLSIILKNNDFCRIERSEIERIRAELDILAFDENQYNSLLAKRSGLARSEVQYQQLILNRQKAENLDNDIKQRNMDIENDQTESSEKKTQYEKAHSEFQQKLQSLPDMKALKAQWDAAAISANRLRQDYGSAQQLLSALEGVRQKREEQKQRADEQRHLAARYKELEKAFGKNGIPALLMEQALPEVEEQANALLQRLTDGNMSLRFDTQKAYKTKKDEQKETLDILISDAYGVRPYEMFSGGEAFRINFSIRLALSQLLTRRAGSRLQTLVIDEGFGSQDDEGRARLIEAIETIRPDFEKILIITHLDELKDAFESRIEVSKTASGTQVEVCP